MSGEVRELLVLLHEDAGESALSELQSQVATTQVVSPRLAVVTATPDAVERLRSTPEVKELFEASVPSAVLESLDDDEALFAAGWQSRQAGPPKQRRGEGLPWDAPGFEPPDPPSNRHSDE